ncbi:MAG: RHS repeat-associated core domain-containing protein [Acidobacteriota bacterium]
MKLPALIHLPTTVLRTMCAALIAMSLVIAAEAQTLTDGSTPLGIEPGTPAGSYALSGLDTVNLFNGGMNFSLPLMHIGGRGGAQMAMTLPIETHWRVFHFSFPGAPGFPPTDTYFPLVAGWGSDSVYGPGVLLGRCGTKAVDCGANGERIGVTLTRLTFTTSDGTEHELRDVATQGKPFVDHFAGCSGGAFNFNRGRVFVSTNGTAMTFIADEDSPIIDNGSPDLVEPSGYLLLRDGTCLRIDESLVTWMRDRNGNRIDFQYDEFGQISQIKDSLNRIVTISHWNPIANPPVWFDQITYDGFGGAPRTVRVWYGPLSQTHDPGDAGVRTNLFRTGTAQGSSGYTMKTMGELFSEFGTGLANPNDPCDLWVRSSVELPDGRRYRFYYNNYVELARVELPTGGAYEYDFQTNSGVIFSTIPSQPGVQIYRRMLERRTYPDGQTLEGRTTYDVPTGDPEFVRVNHLDPAGSVLARERHYFHGSARDSLFQDGIAYPNFDAGKEYQTEMLDPSNNVLRRINNMFLNRATVSWLGTVPDYTGGNPPVDPRVTETTTALTDVTPNQVGKQSFGYDQFNNITDTCDFDFGSGGPGTLLRHTRTTYVVNQFNNTDYTAFDLDNPGSSVHLRSLALAQIVNTSCTDNQTALAKTEYEYDNYTAEGGTNPSHAALAARNNISGHDDAVFSVSRLTRGNVTSVKRWIDESAFAATFLLYDVAGNVVKNKDALGKLTQFDFADRFGTPGDDEARGNLPPSDLAGKTSFAFVTKVTDALGHEAYTQYDYNLGKPVNAEDVNQVVASLYYESGVTKLDRPVKLVSGANFSAVSTQTLITYDDPIRTVTTSSDLTSLGDGQLASAVVYDGLGRDVETRKSEPGGIISTTQSYDAAGRPKTVSNPFRAANEDTYGTTETSYDALSRIVRLETFDKNNNSTGAVTTEYLGNKATVTDQAGKKRRSVSDVLGRLIRVDEPDAVTGNLDNGVNPVQPTSYAYDVLGNLTAVTQQSGATTQTRRFAYDKMSRLIFAANPEQNTSTDQIFTFNSQQWAVRYEYDAASNLKFKTDTRRPGGVFVKVTYAYDDLHRLSSRSYTDGTPSVSYSYDTATKGVGRLATVSASGVSTTNYSAYDPLGRPLNYNQQTAGQTYAMVRAYNRAGLITSETYPSLKVFQTEYDSAGRIAGVSRGGNYYAGAQASDATNRIQYSPAGAVNKIKLGNGLWEHIDFNSRLQPKVIGLGTSATASGTLKLEYDYGTTSNNGNPLSQKITAPTASGTLLLTQSYGYDKLNRLSTANEKVNLEGAARWTQAFSFDRWGNRIGLMNTGELPPANQLAVDPATNRFAALAYDEAGNQFSDASSHPLSHDAENHQKSFTTGSITYNYSYDADGRRVKREYNDGTLQTTVFVYNSTGQLIAEYNSDPVPPAQGGGGVSYLTTDYLDSTRVMTNSAGGVKARHDYLPYGEDVGSTIGSRSTVVGYDLQDGVRQKFTQKERDSESGLDYFLARYYSPAQGRFTGCDTYDPITRSDDEDDFKNFLNQPQSWNRYPYTINSPLKYIDPNGERWFYKIGLNGQVTDIEWVNPNEDGSYTSPGEGWTEFIPTAERPTLQVWKPDKSGMYFFGEQLDGSPRAGFRWGGGVSDHTMDLVVGVLITRGIGVVSRVALGAIAKAGARALVSWRAYQATRAIEEILADAWKLAGKTPAQIQAKIGKLPGNWKVETLGKGKHKGQGWLLREHSANGPTGRIIQHHPGGGHHGPAPYWKVSSGQSGTVRVGPQFRKP